MRLTRITDYPLAKDFLLMLLFGIGSLLFGLVQFYIPGFEGGVSDLREIPLLIGVFHLSNPLVTIGVSAISSLGTPSDGSYLSSFLMHSISLLIVWYLYDFIKKKDYSVLLFGLLWFIIVFIYYLVLLIPLLAITNFLVGLNTDKTFLSIYRGTIPIIRYELISSSIISMLYLMQHRMSKHIKNQKDILEVVVEKRTKELKVSNEKLKTTIQHLKETQLQLIQTEKMASLGVLAAGVAHEINNPLNFIFGGYSGLKNYFKGIKNKDETIKVFLNSIETGVIRAENIVKGLNQFTKSNDNFDENCDINSIIDNCLFMLQSQIKNKVEIETEFFEKSFVVKGNQGMLHHAFLNILTNSVQAIKNKGSVSVITKKDIKNAIVIISDTGIGIEKRYLSKITDPFFTTKEPGKGTGLGLSIAYTIIKDHRGDIEFKSQLDKGTSVIINLPLKK